MCEGLGRRKGADTHLLLCRERLLRSQDDQQLLQGSPLDGLYLDLWVAGRKAQDSMALHPLTKLGARHCAQPRDLGG